MPEQSYMPIEQEFKEFVVKRSAMKAQAAIEVREAEKAANEMQEQYDLWKSMDGYILLI